MIRAIVRIEDSRPLLVFPDEPEKGGAVAVWSPVHGHSTADPAYIRKKTRCATEAESSDAKQRYERGYNCEVQLMTRIRRKP